MLTPMVLYLLYRGYRVLPLSLASIFVYLRFNSPWSRHSAVIMVLTVALFYAWNNRKTLSKAVTVSGVLATVIVALFFQVRGHVSMSESDLSWSDVTTSIAEAGVAASLSASENQMFLVSTATMYLDDRNGYNLGSSLIRELFILPIPRRVFPEFKGAAENVLDVSVLGSDPTSHEIPVLLNSYPGYVGSLYSMGSILAVLIGMYVTGVVVRYLDWLLTPNAVARHWGAAALAIVATFPILLRFSVEAVPMFLGFHVIPLLLVVHVSRGRDR
jgi:hypothetical protein